MAFCARCCPLWVGDEIVIIPVVFSAPTSSDGSSLLAVFGTGLAVDIDGLSVTIPTLTPPPPPLDSSEEDVEDGTVLFFGLGVYTPLPELIFIDELRKDNDDANNEPVEPGDNSCPALEENLSSVVIRRLLVVVVDRAVDGTETEDDEDEGISPSFILFLL